MVDKEDTYLSLRIKMEDLGFIFEKEQQPHFQNKRSKELKFIHPVLEQKFEKSNLKTQAKKFYIKPLSDDRKSEVGLTTGKTSPLYSSDFVSLP